MGIDDCRFGCRWTYGVGGGKIGFTIKIYNETVEFIFVAGFPF